MRFATAGLAALALTLVLTTPRGARAQDARADARAHFERGVELFDEGRLVQALAEFEEAYRISPAPAVLYNVAQLHAELGQSVEAVRAFEQFLSESNDVEPELRAEVEAALRRERARIGALLVTASVAGARISVDDVEVGTAPLTGTVAVSAGEHVVTAQAEGCETVRHRFRIAGGQTYAVSLELVASGSRGSSLRIASRLPGVEIRVDGASLGLTPLDSTVPLVPGPHVVEGVREGYTRFAQNVDVPAGAETTVSIVVERDPAAAASSRSTLSIDLPTASSTVRIDGELVPSEEAAFEIPIGLHDVEIHVGEREPITTRIDVETGAPYELEPVWTWTPDAREARLAAAGSQRDLGWGLAIGGGVTALLGAAAVAIAVGWRDDHIRPFGATVQACSDWLAAMPVAAAEAPCRAGLSRFHAPLTGLSDAEVRDAADSFARANASLYEDNLTAYYALLSGGSILLGLGVVGVVAGGVLVGSAPDEDAIDAAARASLAPTLRVSVGPGGLSLAGTF